MKSVLITGATGFIGRNLIELLVKKSIEIYAYVKDNDPGIEWLSKNGVKNFIYESDLQKANQFNINVCIHLASYGVKYTDKDVQTMVDVNIKLAAEIFMFCAKNGCKLFITAGSCFEYGTQEEGKINETALLNPEDLYAASKVSAETILKVMAEKENIKFLIARPFSVYGKYEPAHRLLPLVYDSGKNKKDLNMTAGMQKRDYLYVKDVANAFYEITINANNFSNGEAINICSGEECYIKDFIETIVDVNGFDRNLYHLGAIDYRKNESMYFVGDNTKLLSKTNWHREYNLLDSIKDYNKWLES